MPNTREKLIELLKKAKQAFWLDRFNSDFYGFVADHLIANGVTVPDKNVGKWIPVTERLPDTDGRYLVHKNLWGSTLFDVIAFAKDGRKIDKYDFAKEWENVWYSYSSEWGHVTTDSVTHWMPLPEPPKED